MDAITRIQSVAGQLACRPIGDVRKLVLPPRICGVYFLIEDQNIVYVGQSADVVRRVNEHLDRGRIKFDMAVYLPCSLGELDEVEEDFIDALKPRYNNTRRRIGAAAYVRHILQTRGPLTVEEIVRLAPEHGVWAQCPHSLQANITRALQRDPLVRRRSIDGRYGPIHRFPAGAEVQ